MDPRSHSRTRSRTSRNFVKAYGMAKFRRLILGFQANESGGVLCTELGVSRQRVHQWRLMFGETVRIYNIYPEIRRILRE